jgi:protein TonB
MALIKNLSAAIATAMLATTSSAGAQQAPPVQPVDNKPAPETYCKPQYPPAALRAQVQGVTTVAFHVEAEGKITQAEILKSSGPTREHHLLDLETVRKLSLCPFSIGRDSDGNPIATVVKIDYTGRLE